MSPRWLLIASVTLLGAGYSWWWPDPRPHGSDFAPVWYSARVLWQEGNPYAEIGPGRSFEHDFPLMYPLTASVAALPLAPLSSRWADRIFVGGSAGLLAWALTRSRIGDPRLMVFASFAWLSAVQNEQWAPLLSAAAITPTLGFLLACKPSLGLALWTAFPNGRAVLLGALLLLYPSILLRPLWPLDWLQAIQSGTHLMVPVTVWGGPLMLLGLLRWREPAGRFLAAQSLIPITPVIGETVPLFLFVRRIEEGVALSALTVIHAGIVWSRPWADYHALMAYSGQWLVWIVYLPTTAWVLWRSRHAAPSP